MHKKHMAVTLAGLIPMTELLAEQLAFLGVFFSFSSSITSHDMAGCAGYI